MVLVNKVENHSFFSKKEEIFVNQKERVSIINHILVVVVVISNKDITILN